ncbi:hypothetical protein K492DRAFT_202485 [Lichtheimia hyalospora FSU 10163]|nr:hypothetical protein K492DRAFT_202485 [Lichtheimia hyalospora FSU 10163]
MTYAKVASRNRQSLMHSELTTKDTNSSSNERKMERIVVTNVFRAGGSPALVPSIFFDISTRGERLKEVMTLLSKAYPNNCGEPVIKIGHYTISDISNLPLD